MKYSEQCLEHSKCSAVISIQVFASMTETLAKVLGLTLVYKPRDLCQINKEDLESHMSLSLQSESRQGPCLHSIF